MTSPGWDAGWDLEDSVVLGQRHAQFYEQVSVRNEATAGWSGWA